MKIYRNFFYEDIARLEVAKAQIFDVCVVVDAVAEIKMFILKSKQCVCSTRKSFNIIQY